MTVLPNAISIIITHIYLYLNWFIHDFVYLLDSETKCVSDI